MHIQLNAFMNVEDGTFSVYLKYLLSSIMLTTVLDVIPDSNPLNVHTGEVGVVKVRKKDKRTI